MTDDEIKAIALAEYVYWRDQYGDDMTQSIQIGAMGAASNIHGALLGHPAPWHPKPAISTLGWQLRALRIVGHWVNELILFTSLLVLFNTYLAQPKIESLLMAMSVRLMSLIVDLRRKGVI